MQIAKCIFYNKQDIRQQIDNVNFEKKNATVPSVSNINLYYLKAFCSFNKNNITRYQNNVTNLVEKHRLCRLSEFL